jgi:hypothetical protein
VWVCDVASLEMTECIVHVGCFGWQWESSLKTSGEGEPGIFRLWVRSDTWKMYSVHKDISHFHQLASQVTGL